MNFRRVVIEMKEGEGGLNIQKTCESWLVFEMERTYCTAHSNRPLYLTLQSIHFLIKA